MKKWISLLVAMVLILSLLLTGCGNANDKADQVSTSEQTKQDDEKTQDNAEVEEKDIELRIVWWGSQERHDRTLKNIELFEEKNPNISIEAEFTSWDGYWEKIAAQAAANSLPDIIQQDYQYLAQYATKGLLVDLDPYVEDGSLDLSDVDENSISAGRLDGKLYGVNLGLNSMFIAYDPALFEQAGVPEPTPDWTWEDYIETCRALHEKLGIYADSSFPGGYFHGFRHYLRQHGQTLYSEDGTKLAYEDDKLFEEFFTMELELVKEGVIARPDVRMEIKSPEDELIITQKAPMAGGIHSNSNQIIAMTAAANRPIKMAMFPKHKDQVQEGHYLKPSMFFSVTSSSSNPDAAVKFIDYFINDVEGNKILMAERGVPISAKVREALMPLLDEPQKQMFEYIDLIIENSSPIDPPEPVGHPEVDKILKNLEEQILYEQITPAEAAKVFREKANEILANSAQQ